MDHLSLDRLTGIIAFARAATLGSYTSAARVLAISPSAVSRSIQRLEHKLGVKLFNRTTRSLTLTQEGKDLYAKALRLIAEVELIEQTAFASRLEPSGVIKITAAISIGIHLIAPHLSKFTSRYPKLSVDLRMGDTFTDLVEEGIDLAIRIGPVADSRLIAKKLATNLVCAYASPTYLKQRGRPHNINALEQHQLINVRYKSSGQPFKWLFRINGGTVELTPNAQIIVDSTDVVLALLLNASGIGMLPSYIASPFVESGQLERIFIDSHVIRHDITAYWLESRRNNPNVKAFIEFLTEIFPESTPWNKFSENSI